VPEVWSPPGCAGHPLHLRPWTAGGARRPVRSGCAALRRMRGRKCSWWPSPARTAGPRATPRSALDAGRRVWAPS